MKATLAPAAGIYIHVPFCRAKCVYCDFYSITALDRIPDYIRALSVEIDRCPHRPDRVDTVYFGGGTPSLLEPRQIGGLLDLLRARFSIAADAEITLEVNPGTVAPAGLRGYRDTGVNRLNLGIQSLDDDALRFLGRIHTAQQGKAAYAHARAAGFDNVGLDLIYGLPAQTADSWALQLAEAARLGADHLSCYTLTLEPGTPLTARVETGRVAPPDEDVVGDLFTHTCAWLNANGYRQYEISNFARDTGPAGPDRRSRHNRKYWTFAPYLGFGPVAHSYLDGRRWWNHRSLDRYLTDLSAGRSPVAGDETLSRDQQMIEFIYLGLRQTDGIDTIDFARRFDSGFFDAFGTAAAELRREGLLEHAGERVRLTAPGMRFLESVAGRLLG